MRNVRKGNVSVPLAIVDQYIKASLNPEMEGATEAALNMHKALVMAVQNIDKGLKQSNLSVCIGKLAFIDPKDAQRFLSGEIPRVTLYAAKKDKHNMPLYYKHKPSFYQANPAQRKPRRARSKVSKK